MTLSLTCMAGVCTDFNFSVFQTIEYSSSPGVVAGTADGLAIVVYAAYNYPCTEVVGVVGTLYLNLSHLGLTPGLIHASVLYNCSANASMPRRVTNI